MSTNKFIPYKCVQFLRVLNLAVFVNINGQLSNENLALNLFLHAHYKNAEFVESSKCVSLKIRPTLDSKF